MDNQMDIMLTAEFEIDVPGIASGYLNRAHARKLYFVTSNHRDFYNVESTMKWIKNVLTSKRIYEQMITFSTWYFSHEHSYFRIIHEEEGYRIIHWDDNGWIKKDLHKDKYPAKAIEDMYMTLADIAIDKNNSIQSAAG